jgi:hypothetical protein
MVSLHPTLAPDQQPGQRCLAGSVGAHQGVDLARLKDKTNLVEKAVALNVDDQSNDVQQAGFSMRPPDCAWFYLFVPSAAAAARLVCCGAWPSLMTKSVP